jgi:hypothetical protein
MKDFAEVDERFLSGNTQPFRKVSPMVHQM